MAMSSDDDGIHHRRDDLVLDLLRLFLELGETDEHQLGRTPPSSRRLHHVHRETVEDFRVVAEALG